MKVFISYNHANKDAATLLAEFVKHNEMRVWLDDYDVAAGDSLPGKIAEGLAESSHFVLVWSKKAETSNWVTTELENAISRAIGTGSPKIIPVVLDKTPVPELLRNRKYVKAWPRKHTTRALWDLAREIAGKGPSDDWLKDFVRAYHVLNAAYEEAVLGASHLEHPFGYSACPRCGSRELKASGTAYMGYAFGTTDCPDCGYHESGEI